MSKFRIATPNWTFAANSNVDLLKLARAGRIHEDDQIVYSYGRKTCRAGDHPLLRDFFKKTETEKTQVAAMNPLLFSLEHEQAYHEQLDQSDDIWLDEGVSSRFPAQILSFLWKAFFLALTGLLGIALVRGFFLDPIEAVVWDEALRSLLGASSRSSSLTPTLTLKTLFGALFGALGGYFLLTRRNNP